MTTSKIAALILFIIAAALFAFIGFDLADNLGAVITDTTRLKVISVGLCSFAVGTILYYFVP